jgi:hypothetical protein
MALRRKKYKVKLPAEPFVLLHETGNYDGPFDPEFAVEQEDGAMYLYSDGGLRVLRVTKQKGNVLTTFDSGTITLDLMR